MFTFKSTNNFIFPNNLILTKCFSLLNCSILFTNCCLLFFLTFPNIVIGASEFVSSHEISSRCGQIPGLLSNDIRTQVPWTAGLYTRPSRSSPFKFLTSGIILGENTILTLFGGPFPTPNYRIEDGENYLVAVGLKSTNLRDGDQNTQISYVSHVLPYFSLKTSATLRNPLLNETIYDGSYNKYHYVLLHLKRKLDLSSPFARSACLPGSEEPRRGNNEEREYKDFAKSGEDDLRVIESDGFFGGFSSPATAEKGGFPLYKSSIKTENVEECSEAFKFYYKESNTNLICGRGDSKRTNIHFEGGNDHGIDLRALRNRNERCLLHGSSLMAKNSQTVVGILALIPKRTKGKCNTNTIYFFGNVQFISIWISKNVYCSEKEMYACADGTCIPFISVCNGKDDCNDKSDEDESYCKASLGSNCSSGHQCHLHGKCIRKEKLCDGKEDCPSGTDEEFALCLKTRKIQEHVAKFQLPSTTIKKSERNSCLAIPHYEGVKLSCHDRNQKPIPCGEVAEEGTILTRSCAEFFVSKQRYKYWRMTCGPDGQWTPFKAFVCKADCGIINREEIAPFIANGRPVNNKNSFPWHAAIFQKDANGGFRYICGGSLIEKNVILSAAHCVTDEFNNYVQFDSLQIVLAPLNPNYEDNVEDLHAQIFSVKGIWKPRTFQSSSQLVRSDISLIQLDQPVNYTSFIRPVCYLMSNLSQKPPVGKLGKVPGFGATKFDKVSQYLSFAQIPTAAPAACEKNLNVKLSQAMFCGGFHNGSISTCQGDSGGGFVFTETVRASHRKYVLKGIVSFGKKPKGEYCSDESYNVFTHVDSFNVWILDILNKYVFNNVNDNENNE